MNATLLCVALLVPAYGEKDIRKALKDAGVRGGIRTHTARGVNYGPYQALAFQWAQGTDALLGELCELQTFPALLLDKSDVTDTGLTAVGGLKKLEYLDLEGTAVTDAGLRQLEGMSGLRVLDLSNCPGVTDASIVRLRMALPKCEIIR